MFSNSNDLPAPIPDDATAAPYELARSAGVLSFWDKEPDLYSLEEPCMWRKFRSRLHRLRLRLGLFRAKNYAELFHSQTKPDIFYWRWRDTDKWCDDSEIWSDKDNKPTPEASTRHRAIRHIRRSIKLGVRP